MTRASTRTRSTPLLSCPVLLRRTDSGKLKRSGPHASSRLRTRRYVVTLLC